MDPQHNISIRLLPYDNYSVSIPKADLLELFPGSLFAEALQKDLGATEIDITNPDVTPMVLNELFSLYTTQKYSTPAYDRIARYLNIPALTVIHNPKILREIEGYDLLSPTLDDYEQLMQIGIMEGYDDLVSYLLTTMSDSRVDQNLLGLAILRNNVYAAKSLIRDHSIDPLEAHLGGDLPLRANEFSEPTEDEYVNYGLNVLEIIGRYTAHPVWGYIGFKLYTVDPPSLEMINLLLSTASSPSTVIEVFDWREPTYIKYLDQGIEYHSAMDPALERIIDYLGPDLDNRQIDHILETLQINLGEDSIPVEILNQLQDLQVDEY